MLSNYEENNTSAIIEPLARGVSAIRLDLGSSEASPLPSNRQSEQTEVNLRSPSENGNSSVIPKATNAKDSNSNTDETDAAQRTKLKVFYTEIEDEFWKYWQYIYEDRLPKMLERITKCFDDKQALQNQTKDAIKLSEKEYKFIVLSLIAIQQYKLDRRGESLANGSKYEVEYKASPPLNDHDALKLVVSFGKETFNIISNYDAKSNSHQPGNHILRHSIREPLSYKSKPPKRGPKDPEVMLLFLLEIVRRRIIDHRQDKQYGGLKDDFHDLPVGLGIAMAYEFMKKDKFFENFWKTDGKYHMFTGDKTLRWNAFWAIHEHYKNEHLKSTSPEMVKKLLTERMTRLYSNCWNE
ncbi:unnamed protein product [Rotaria magnacalcarata]|uniref:Uncharacterized protein n=4 Tax=Rotaria magnacalcarata TaxID=392030 RepID=A0A816SH89_9BILA|nr:unnamed protein product [Rotaria magnacalcarata]CAF1653433.1 unnamed protein product [Rotaria magnacalcarata]CAF1935110.1 unnamed protein product [Rotaria magnacalcarata]CAF2040079.1 unnamed protein product [Rotaria magnacalcarata]CAF2085623.1 unnamed protein product [Rotaria magnacalcarata]